MVTCEPTDDIGLSSEFLCDEDVARDDDSYEPRRQRCTCGFVAAMHEAEQYDHRDYPSHHDFAGCEGCDPVDFENRPYGFGIEAWEDAPRMAAHRATRALRSLGLLNDATADAILSASTTTYRPKIAWAALRKWEAITNRVETNRAAREEYRAWAERIYCAGRPRMR